MRKARGTSQCPSVGRADAPPRALRGPKRQGHRTSQLQFSRYSPSIRQGSAMVRVSLRSAVESRDCRCRAEPVSTTSRSTVLASPGDGPCPRCALPDDRAAAGAHGARRGRARTRGGLVPGRRARHWVRAGRRRARDERPVPLAPRRASHGDRVEGLDRRPPPRRPGGLPRRPRRPRRRAPAQHHARQPYRRLRRGRSHPLPASRDRRGRRTPGRHALARAPRSAGARAGDPTPPRAVLSAGEGRGPRRRVPSRPPRERGADRQGRAQAARRAGARLAAVFTSDLERARRTAEIIASPHGLTPTMIPALREMAMGRWDGRTAEEIRRSEPAAFADWMARVGEVPFPEGESVPDLRARAWPAFVAIVAAHAGESIAIVAHGGPNRATPCNAPRLQLPPVLPPRQDYRAPSRLERVAEGW